MNNSENSTFVRLIVMIAVGINSIATMYGHTLIPFTNEEISIGISAVALVGSEIWNHWKNNNYTKRAKEAQKHIDESKAK